MTSAIRSTACSSFVHADLDITFISPLAAPAVSGNPELFAPGVLKSLWFGLPESYNSDSMVNRLLFIAALSNVLSQNPTFVSPKSFSDDDANTDWLFGDESLEISI